MDNPASLPGGRATDRVLTVFAPAAMFLRAALFTYLAPRLVITARPYCWMLIDRVLAGVTSRSYRRQTLIAALADATDGKLQAGDGIEDLWALLAALEPEVRRADRVTLAVAWDAERDAS
jgi:hypothetical protein